MYDIIGPVEWSNLSVYELATWKNGLAFKDINFSAGGKPVIKIAELKAGITEQTKFTEEIYDEKVHVRKHDLLFSWSGNPDTSIDVFRWDGPDGWLNQHIFKILPNDCVSDEFLFFILKWLKPRFADIARNKQTTGLGHVTIQDLKAMRVAIPNQNEQQLILSVVKPLQDKIDINRRTNNILEAMARALFKEWFVDFGPVRAKLEGREPDGLARETAPLFPNALDAEGKPVGWQVLPLDEMAEFLNGLALQKFPGSAPDDLPVIKIADLRAGKPTSGAYASRTIPSQYIIHDGDVIFSWSGSLIQRIWTAGNGALNQHLFKVSSKEYPKWLHYYWVDYHLPTFQAIAAAKATTMGHIQRHHLTEAKTIVGPKPLMDAADEIFAPIFDRIIANDLESRTLAQLRDLLLPKLMSGELRLSDVERLVAETL